MVINGYELNIDRKNLLIGSLLVLLGVSAPLIANVDNFKIYNMLHDSLEYNNQGYLILAAIRLVLLNGIRGLPHYLGTFIIAESIDIKIRNRSVPHIKGLIALIIIPLVYSAINTIHGIKYDLGAVAFIVIFAIIYLEKMDFSRISFIKKAIIITLLLLGVQWLDVIPQLSILKIGRGETSQDIKAIASIIEGTEVLGIISSIFFILFTFTAILVTKLINDEQKLIISAEENERVEKELNEARISALQARSYIELKNLVHDLKTPVTSVQALITVLGLMEEDEKMKSYLGRVEGSVDNLNDMISEILYEDKKNNITTNELFDYILSHISPLPYALKVRYKNENKNAIVHVNKIRLSRAIINALDNSYNALDKNHGNIYLHVYSRNENVYIVVEDDGKGIKEEFLEEVRQRGYSKNESTGLGLSFIEDVINSHDGELFLDSKDGVGTKLKIILPRVIMNDK